MRISSAFSPTTLSVARCSSWPRARARACADRAWNRPREFPPRSRSLFLNVGQRTPLAPLARSKTAIDALVAVMASCGWFAADETEQHNTLGLLITHDEASSYASFSTSVTKSAGMPTSKTMRSRLHPSCARALMNSTLCWRQSGPMPRSSEIGSLSSLPQMQQCPHSRAASCIWASGAPMKSRTRARANSSACWRSDRCFRCSLAPVASRASIASIWRAISASLVSTWSWRPSDTESLKL